MHDGTNVARRGDVVVVTVNHRLGALGYLHLEDFGGEAFRALGNRGCSTRRGNGVVRDNIEAFGGDPATSPSSVSRVAASRSRPARHATARGCHARSADGG